MAFDLLRARGVAAAWATALMGASGLALAGAGDLSVVVAPLSDAVTYSRAATTSPARPALNMVIGYTVSVANAGGNTINSIRFTGNASATETREPIEFASFEGGNCMASGSSIDCAIGQLKAGQSAPTFAVFFKSPIKVTTDPVLPDGVAGLCTTTDCVSFAGTAFYAEGTGGLANSIPKNSALPWSSTEVLLGTANNLRVKTAVSSGGGSLFTGDGGVTTGNDKFTTAVTVPPAATYTTALVDEAKVSVDGVGCTSFTECFSSTITIPGTFSPYLSITLRQDASTIRKGTKIESVLIEYKVSDTDLTGVIIGDCASPTTPRTDGVPCIAKRTHYRNKSVPGWTAELDGDFEWLILNTTNGSYKGF